MPAVGVVSGPPPLPDGYHDHLAAARRAGHLDNEPRLAGDDDDGVPSPRLEPSADHARHDNHHVRHVRQPSERGVHGEHGDEGGIHGGGTVSDVTLVRLADVQPERVDWLWTGRIPRGKLTVVDSDPGMGKSTIRECTSRMNATYSQPCQVDT